MGPNVLIVDVRASAGGGTGKVANLAKLNTSNAAIMVVFRDFKQTWKRRLAMADGGKNDSGDGWVEWGWSISVVPTKAGGGLVIYLVLL